MELLRKNEEIEKTRRDTIPRKKRNVESSGVRDDESETIWLIRHYFPENSETAIAIAKAESGLNNLADNGKCIGIFQIMLFPSRPSREELYDAETNIRTARQIYDDSGWNPWTVWTSGNYKKYLGG